MSAVASTCQGCLANCSVLVHPDGHVEGNPANESTHGAICPNVRMAEQQRTDPDRLLYPLRRTNPRKGRNEPPRFERISWDEALDEIAKRLIGLRERSEGHRVAFAKGRSTGLSDLLMKALPDIYGTPNRLNHDSICAEAEKLATGVLDGTFDYHDYDFARTTFVLMWGTDPLAGNRLKSRFIADFASLRKRATLVSISPNRGVTSQKAHEWLPVIPGTDGALASAMAHVILTEGLWNRAYVGDFAANAGACSYTAFEPGADASSHAAFKPGVNACPHTAFEPGARIPERAFVEKHTLGLATWWNEVLKDATPAWAEPLCGIGADRIRSLARQFAAAGPRAISWISPGVSMTARGLYSGMACYALNGLVGSTGPGGCVLKFPSLKTAKLPATDAFQDDIARTANARPALAVPRTRGLAAAKNGRLDSYPVLNIVPEAVLGEKPYALDMLIAYWVNFAYSCTGAHRWERALEKIPFFVHVTTNLSETSQFADIVLPARHHLFEDWGFVRSRMGGRTTVTLEQPCLESPGECLGDETDFPFALAEKLAAGGFNAPLRYYRSLVDPCTGDVPENGRELGEFACKIMLEPLWSPAGDALPPSERQAAWNAFRKRGAQSSEPAAQGNTCASVDSSREDTTHEGMANENGDGRGIEHANRNACENASASAGTARVNCGTAHANCDSAHANCGTAHALPTPSGCFEFASRHLRALLLAYADSRRLTLDQAMESLGYEARGKLAFLPHYESPLRFGDPVAYPLIFTQSRSRLALEGRAANTERFQQLKGSDPGDEPWDDVLKLHPLDMAALGLRTGDTIRVTSLEGSIVCHAKEWDGTRPGVAAKCYGQGHWAYGHVAALDFERAVARGGNNNEIISAAYERVSSATARHGGLMRIRVERLQAAPSPYAPSPQNR